MKKIFIIVPLVMIVLAVVLLILMTATNQNPGGKNTLIRSVYLEKIPAGTQFDPKVKGTFATTFKKDDQMALSGEASFTGKASLIAKILKEGEVEQKDVMPAMELKSGNFGFCCLTVPSETGGYSLYIYTNGTEETISPLSFKVVE